MKVNTTGDKKVEKKAVHWACEREISWEMSQVGVKVAMKDISKVEKSVVQ